MSQLTYNFSVGSVYLLDDDPNFLRNLRFSLNMRTVPIRSFEQPIDCLRELTNNVCVWVNSLELQREIIDRWRTLRDESRLLHDILDFWSRGMQYERCNVLVLDYQMPGMNGMEFLQQVTQLPAQRILLTGQADEKIACDMFNEGLIQQFVPKGDNPNENTLKRLRERIIQLRLAAITDESLMWRACLSFEQTQRMKKNELSLIALGEVRGWVEHVVLPSPFGVLARDRKGRVEFLSLEAEPRSPVQSATLITANPPDLPGFHLYELQIQNNAALPYQMTLERYMLQSSSQEPSYRRVH